MNHVNVSIVVQLHHHKIHVGVKMVVDLIYVINVEFIRLVRIKFQPIRLYIQQEVIPMIEIFERVYVFLKVFNTFFINFLSGHSSSFRQSMCKLLYNRYNIMETKCEWRKCLQCMWSLL